jgi:methionyl-tRNA formyltransferase
MRILFIGTGAIGVPVLERLHQSPDHHLLAAVTQPDKPAGRSQELLASPVKTVALRHHVPVFQPDKIRDPAAIEQIRFLRPEIIAVMAYGQILPREILQIPSVACLNLHASLLPRHRGAAPIQASIESGDRVTGITVMHMAEGLDTGDILLKKQVPIRRRETGGSLHDRLAEIAPDAFFEALRLLKLGMAPRIPQEEREATYAPKLTREHGELDWSKPAIELERTIRAMNPWPAACTFIPGQTGNRRKLKVFSAIIHRRRAGQPGEVLEAGKHGILIAAGTGALLLREIQLEGKKRMNAREFLLGNPVSAGTVFG